LGFKGGIDATNTSNNFDFRNYSADIDAATVGIDKYLPLKKTIDPQSVSLGAKMPIPMFRMGLSIGIAY